LPPFGFTFTALLGATRRGWLHCVAPVVSRVSRREFLLDPQWGTARMKSPRGDKCVSAPLLNQRVSITDPVDRIINTPMTAQVRGLGLRLGQGTIDAPNLRILTVFLHRIYNHEHM
ncbi:hypothetical protein, partial [Mycobacteroides abscessus]|uniref:hypothetical protein n=1 Tax=Mycobacteroides abscessus TaxID=36809 RepID=UPI001A988E66